MFLIRNPFVLGKCQICKKSLTKSKSNENFSDIEFQIETWKIIKTVFGSDRNQIGMKLIQHQLGTFIDFIRTKVEYNIQGFNDIEI